MSSASLVVHSVNRKAVPLQLRSSFAVLAAALEQSLSVTAQHLGEELVVLNTCERFEVYRAGAAGDVDALPGDSALQFLDIRVLRGNDALRHLFRVASGLESYIPGEPHVLGQVRVALNQAKQRHSAHAIVGEAFANAIQCGKRVRTLTSFGSHASHYATHAVQKLQQLLGSLHVRHVGVLGTGALAAQVAHGLKEVHVGELTIVGRHAARTELVARAVDARWLTIDSLRDSGGQFDALITAVNTPQPVITLPLRRTCNCSVFIDLGAAPNVDPAVDMLPRVRVLRLDALGGNGSSPSAIAQAEAMVEHELIHFSEKHSRKAETRNPFNVLCAS